MRDDEVNSVPDLESDYEDQENINGAPNYGVQDDGIFGMHNINIMFFPDEVIRINKQIGQIVPLRNIVRGQIEPILPRLESWAVAANGASDACTMYEANDIWVQHGLHPRVKLAYGLFGYAVSEFFSTTKSLIQRIRNVLSCLIDFHLQTLCIPDILSIQLRCMQPKGRSMNTITARIHWAVLKWEKVRQ
jgi:hypothetical protein